MRTYHAGCHVCDWVKNVINLDRARSVADEHDKDNHKKRPVSYFGWQAHPFPKQSFVMTVNSASDFK